MASRKRKSSTHNPQEDALLGRLQAGLADTEIRDVLIASLRSHDRKGQARLLARLDPATAAVLAEALKPPRSVGAAPALKPSRGKLRQEWDALWVEWNDCVAEAGLEDGRYVRQDHHWEAPYHCPEELSSDLDAIAKRLRPLLVRVRKAGIASELSFLHQIRALDDELGSGLPEYMDPGSLELLLGPETTSCMLEWEGGGTGKPHCELFELVDAICRLETRLAHVFFDARSVARYLADWPEEALETLLHRIAHARNEPHWVHALQHAHSGWFRLVLGLAWRWNRDLHADLSVAHASEDFTLLAPLVSEAMRRRDHGAAKSLLAVAFRAILSRTADSDWDPSSQLLVLQARGHWDASEKRMVERLLRARRKIAKTQGEDELASALDLQLVAWQAPEDGERMVAAFREMSAPKLVRQRLLGEWNTLVAQRSLRGFGRSRDDALEQWVPALVHAAIEGPAEAPTLRRGVRQALAHAGKLLKQRGGTWAMRDLHQWEHRPELFTAARLTLDLDARGRFAKEAPSLCDLLRRIVCGRPSQLDAIRKRWFAQLGGAGLLDDIAMFWRKHVGDLVPDPQIADYGACVKWLVAARELDGDRGARILAEWARAHRLKYTLWRAVRLAGIPVPPGVRIG